MHTAQTIVQRYQITYDNFDMPDDYTSKSIKWAHNEKDAVKLITKKAPDKDGICQLKRGSTARIIEVKEI